VHLLTMSGNIDGSTSGALCSKYVQGHTQAFQLWRGDSRASSAQETLPHLSPSLDSLLDSTEEI